MSGVLLNPYRHQSSFPQVTFVGSTFTELASSWGHGSGGYVISCPAGVQAGDLMLLFVSNRNSYTSNPDGGGWTTREYWSVNNHSLAGGGSTNDNVYLWTKTATGSQSQVSFTHSDSGTNGAQIHLAVYRDAYLMDHDWVMESTASSLSGIQGGFLHCYWNTLNDGRQYTSVPGSMTELHRSNNHPQDLRFIAANEYLSASGATGTRTASHTGIAFFETAASVVVAPSS